MPDTSDPEYLNRVRSGTIGCPVCGEEKNIDTLGFDAYKGYALWAFLCGACGTTWELVYDLKSCRIQRKEQK